MRQIAPLDLDRFDLVVDPDADTVIRVLDDFITWCKENRARITAARYEQFCQDFVLAEVMDKRPPRCSDRTPMTPFVDHDLPQW